MRVMVLHFKNYNIMQQSIIDKIELIEKENRLRKRAIKLGICPICGEKTEQYTFEERPPYGTTQKLIKCTSNINHYNSGEFVYDDDYFDYDA